MVFSTHSLVVSVSLHCIIRPRKRLLHILLLKTKINLLQQPPRHLLIETAHNRYEADIKHRENNIIPPTNIRRANRRSQNNSIVADSFRRRRNASSSIAPLLRVDFSRVHPWDREPG